MWKIVLGFIVFAGLVMFVLTRPGADIDLGGEKHGMDAAPAASAASSAY